MLLAVEGLTHRYGDKTALDQFTMHLNRREIVGLLGPNGSGKSTLLRVLSTLVKPQTGRVEICGFDAGKLPEAVRSRIGVVFQTPTLDPLLTVEENLLIFGSFFGISGRALHERVRHLMQQFGILDRRTDFAKTLSGGLRRRAEIARALLHEPQLLIFDEPTSGLDPAARDDFWKAIEELREKRSTAILISTHLFDEAERCDSLILLHRGLRVAEGTPAELKATIGGQIVELVAKKPEAALETLRAKFGAAIELSDGILRVEAKDAHQMIPSLVEALPGEVLSVGLHQPTLADVFRKVTA
ncbi:ABC transporter ATP-binding protein [Bryobacter aggregatus]|uniref:ABC transporter ATP-binding protein n=1 Tax=Bryobacter aggregatus TaxID=360054 RepID=UPI0005631B27|nr:ABC transporter ATP-binding protein [Bryobacter aggregatus]